MVYNPSIDTIKESIGSFDKKDKLIKLVYLFGSVLKKPLSEASDIDLAFLIDEARYAKDPIQATYTAYDASTKVGLKLNKKTDVVILNSSSIEISYEVVTMGFCIYALDSEARLEYEVKIRGMYYDFMPFISDLRDKKSNQLR